MLPTTLMAAPMTHVAAPIVAEATQNAAPDQLGALAACLSAPVLRGSVCTLLLMPEQLYMPFEGWMSRSEKPQRVQLWSLEHWVCSADDRQCSTLLGRC